MRNTKPLLIACLSLALFAQAGRLAAQELSSREIYRKTLRSVGLVAKGTPRGTAWVVDRANRVMITNHHVVDTDAVVEVIFPAYRDGVLIAESEHYRGAVRRHTARVVEISPKDDLAILQLDTLPEGIAELPLAPVSVTPAERVHSVGNPSASGALWVYTSGTVRAVYNKKWRAGNDPSRIYSLDTRVVETQSPTNPGDSGGPLVNDKGELVGVTQGNARGGQLVSWFVDVTRVRAFLTATERLIDPQTADDFNQRGVKRFTQGLFDEAVTDFNSALRLGPDNAQYLSNRASALASKGDYTTALVDLARALELNPELDHAWFWRGWALEQQGEYEPAVEAYTRALELRPNYPVALNNRGTIHNRLGRLAEAMRDYSEAIRLDPQYGQAYANRGLAHTAQRNYKLAILDYTQAIQHGSGDAHILAERGNAYFALKQWDEALKDYAAAIDLTPDDVAIWVNAGVTLFKQGEHDKAIKVYNKAISLNPNYARAYFNRAEVFEVRGQPDQAHADYEKAIQLAPALAKLAPTHTQRYLRVVNKTRETLTVSLRYEAQTRDGGWLWYRAGKGVSPVTVTLRPGESVDLADEGWRVRARRVRLWAEGSQGGRQGDANQDLWLARSPYRAQGVAVYTFAFTQ